MILLLDVGNTHTHLGLSNSRRVTQRVSFPSSLWLRKKPERIVQSFLGKASLKGAVLCSVVPPVTGIVRTWLNQEKRRLPFIELNHKTARRVGVDYPKPETIGADRLANAVAVKQHYGAPAIVVDFGTAVTFDVVNGKGNYAGGIIAPGLSVMTTYLHEKTALLPAIQIGPVKAIIGKSTKEAMLIGAVYGYRGLIRELVTALKKKLRVHRLPVVATGGYAELITAGLREITAVDSLLTLEGLRLVWEANTDSSATRPRGES